MSFLGPLAINMLMHRLTGGRRKRARRVRGGRKRMIVGGRRRRVRRVMGGRRRRMRGRGFFSNIWNGIKSVGSRVGNFVKDQRLISKGLALIPDPRARAAAAAANAVGLGRRRRRYRKRRAIGGRRRRVRRVRRMRGGSLMGVLRKAHDLVKRHKLVSRGLSHFGHNRLSNAASALGYGRRRRVYRRRR